jgi:hypothetical protein
LPANHQWVIPKAANRARRGLQPAAATPRPLRFVRPASDRIGRLQCRISRASEKASPRTSSLSAAMACSCRRAKPGWMPSKPIPRTRTPFGISASQTRSSFFGVADRRRARSLDCHVAKRESDVYRHLSRRVETGRGCMANSVRIIRPARLRGQSNVRGLPQISLTNAPTPPAIKRRSGTAVPSLLVPFGHP